MIAVLPVLGSGLLAAGLGWWLGPSLQERFDEIAQGDRLHGKPVRLLATIVVALPFAAFGDSALSSAAMGFAAAIGWLPGLVLRSRRAELVGPVGARNRAGHAAPAESLVDSIDALLPQTQCGQCTFPGCRPYARAIAEGKADINQCPPGGAAGIRALGELLGREPKPLNPAHGVEKPKVVARIVEEDCIGCTKCIQACPVDAIVGAPKRMHTVIAELCTGCELCLPPCPVDCIELLPVAVAVTPRAG